MTPRERVAIAFQGGKPDRIPIVPIYDVGYICKNTGRDVRSWNFHTRAERIQFAEDTLLLHNEIDGVFVHANDSVEAARHLKVAKFESHWRVTDTRTGEHWGLLSDGSKCTADGVPIPRQGENLFAEAKFRTAEDIERLLGPVPTEAQVEATGRFVAFPYLRERHPEYHFSFQSGTPVTYALVHWGFVEGLSMMASEPDLFKKLLARYADEQCVWMKLGKKAGADSTWFTSYYTGADTISPKTYAEIIFPFDYQICREAKRQGLFVLHWYLGDLMPNLDKVMELPTDALVLEQGRKGYAIDPVEIRKRVGPKFCLFGFGYENDYCTFNRAGLENELRRQIQGAGLDGAFVVGTPIMPPNANPAAVDFYFQKARELGNYSR